MSTGRVLSGVGGMHAAFRRRVESSNLSEA